VIRRVVLVALAGATAAALAVGSRGVIATSGPGRLTTSPPEDLVVVVLRFAALGLSIHLAIAVLLASVTSGHRRLQALVVGLTLPPLRALVAWATLGVAAASAAASNPDPPPVAVMTLEVASPTPVIPTPVEAVSPAPRATPTYTVVAGDHFWAIAGRVLGRRLDRPPSASEVAAYWRRLIDANRDRLVHRGNPDLIYPGQVLVLPEP